MCGCRMHDVKQAADAVEDGEVATEEPASRALSLFNAIRMTSDPGINPHRAAHLNFSVLSYCFLFVSKNKTNCGFGCVQEYGTAAAQITINTNTHTEKHNGPLVM